MTTHWRTAEQRGLRLRLIFESATGQSPLVLKSITRHHRQSSRISRGFREAKYSSVSSGWVALRGSTNSPFSLCYPAFLQTRRFLHFPAFLQTHRFLNFQLFYKLAVFYISPRFYKSLLNSPAFLPTCRFSPFFRVSTNSPSRPFPRFYM